LTPKASALACCRGIWGIASGTLLAASLANAAVPDVCRDESRRSEQTLRAPPAIESYFALLGQVAFDQRAACARWAGTFSERNRRMSQNPSGETPQPARFILIPAGGLDIREFAEWLADTAPVRDVEIAEQFVVVTFSRRLSTRQLREFLLTTPQIEYAEPDCDGPDFMTTSQTFTTTELLPHCWQRSARTTFPNDPCIDELWGHSKIGWDSGVAARSLPRLVAILDSGIDARHEDLASNVMISFESRGPRRSQGGRLNALCATSGRCYPHGTEMAGTIGGRMDNGIGVAGVAPNSRLLPIVISRVEHGTLGRLSTIARGIDAAARGDADVINISAKWPVDSRAISMAIHAAVGGDAASRRLIVTGYATALDTDESVREYFPSQYRGTDRYARPRIVQS
jgi:subtilisin family serine protease